MLAKPVYKLKEDAKLYELHQMYAQLQSEVEPALEDLKIVYGLDLIEDEKHFGFTSEPADFIDGAYKLKHGKYYVTKYSESYGTFNMILANVHYDKYKELGEYLKLIYIRFYAEKGSAFSPLFPEKLGTNYYIGGDNVAHNEYLLESYEPVPYEEYKEDAIANGLKEVR